MDSILSSDAHYSPWVIFAFYDKDMKLKISKEFIENCKDILIQNWTGKVFKDH